MKNAVIEYLQQTYHPRAILLYGSYARGDADQYSDFDCMVIVDSKSVKHDARIIDGVPLDCFIFTAAETVTEDPEAFLTAYHAELAIDDGVGQALQTRVQKYVRDKQKADAGEKAFIRSWAQKTLHRIQKGDDEGQYRAVVLLNESLPDYYALRDLFYFGSKEAIRHIKDTDAKGYQLFHQAVHARTNNDIERWIRHVIDRP